MRIPLLSSLAPLLFSSLHEPRPDALAPALAPTPAQLPPGRSRSVLTFTPRHAHAHALDPAAPLLLHDGGAAGAAAFLAPPPPPPPPGASPEAIAAAAAAAADHVAPDEVLAVRTRRQILRRPTTRAPHMLSWARAARASAHGLGVNATGWIAPTYATAAAAGSDGSALVFRDDTWEDVEVEVPDMRDRQTVLTLAKLASNAYTTPENNDGWYGLPGWNSTIPFGWETDADGLRGHVFADNTNSTVIISIKGTSAGVLGGGGPTSKNDKFNDNLMFSCCCARVDFSWSTVCDCYAGGYKCEQACLEDALISESVYATVGTNLYNNITYLYPHANIWLTGHSLGGSLSALIGLAFGAPAVGFEAPGDRLPARRLHLPQPPGIPAAMSGITHVYHTADPIPMGACTGTYSGCYAAGFALESKCHTGQTILYDTVTVKGWSVDVRTHRITEVINKVLSDPWPVGDDSGDADDDDDDDDDDDWDGGEGWLSAWWGWGRKDPHKGGSGRGRWDKHNGVPRAKPEDDCVDCYKWEFGDGWGKK